MAIKILGVGSRGRVQGLPGQSLLDDGGHREQDFLLINTPAFAFANASDYLRLTKVIHANNDDPTRFFAPLNPQVPGFTDEDRARTKRSFEVVQEIKSKAVTNPLGVQYFGAAPFLFGPDRVMKFSAVPAGGEQPQILPPGEISDNYLAGC